MTQDYVVGFLMSDEPRPWVVLIKKNRPDWQKDKWNGVGGHVEDNEDPYEAMCREFAEETGLKVEDWDLFANLKGDWGNVWFYRAFLNPFHLAQAKTLTDEEIDFWQVDDLPNNIIPNLKYLIPMANYRDFEYHPVVFEEV